MLNKSASMRRWPSQPHPGADGPVPLGDTAFFAMGAYTTAILNTVYHWPVFATMPIAGVLAAIFAFVLAKPIIHLRGDYLLIVTIGIVEIVRIALTNNLFGLTGGGERHLRHRPAFPVRDGVLVAQAPVLPHLDLHHPDHVPVLRAGAFPLRQGAQLHPLRRSRGIGLRHRRDLHKLMAFTVGAFWAGMVGTLFAANIRTIEPTSFEFSTNRSSCSPS